MTRKMLKKEWMVEKSVVDLLMCNLRRETENVSNKDIKSENRRYSAPGSMRVRDPRRGSSRDRRRSRSRSRDRRRRRRSRSDSRESRRQRRRSRSRSKSRRETRRRSRSNSRRREKSREKRHTRSRSRGSLLMNLRRFTFFRPPIRKKTVSSKVSFQDSIKVTFAIEIASWRGNQAIAFSFSFSLSF